MNQNMKEKRKFNFVDAIIILIILAAAALIAFVFVFRGAQTFKNLLNGGEQHKMYYAVEIPLVKNEIIEIIKDNETAMQGNTVTDSINHKEIGKIAYVTVNDAEYEGSDRNGNVVAGYYPDCSSVILIIQNESSSFSTQVGKTINLSSAHFVGAGHCLYFNDVPEFSAEELQSFMDVLSTRMFSIKEEEKTEDQD